MSLVKVLMNRKFCIFKISFVYIYLFYFKINNSLSYHRPGFTYVEDIKGFSFKNYDTKVGKELNEAVQVN